MHPLSNANTHHEVTHLVESKIIQKLEYPEKGI